MYIQTNCASGFSNKLYHLLSQANPKCLLIVTPKGGHLGWVAGAEAPLGAPWTDPVVMDFLEHLERGSSEPSAACSNPKDLQQSSEGLHHLEV